MVTVVLALLFASTRHEPSPNQGMGSGSASAVSPVSPVSPPGGPAVACPVRPTAGPSPISGNVSEDSAIDIARAHVGGHVTAARAQLMTLGEYVNGAGDAALPGQGPHLATVAGDDLVWIVSMRGSFGEAGSGRDWAVVVVDAATGAVVGDDLEGEEPAFFSDLPDRNRHQPPSC